MERRKLQVLLEEWLPEATIDEMQEKMENGDLTAKELVLLYMSRIASIDKQGPAINSILELNPEAVQIAAAMDAERILKGPRGPLHGIPVLIKDNINTADKLHTSAGSLALQHSYAPEDSTVASKLREAGAVILGKTNMTEWANFMANEMPSGYSSRGGQVLNPYGPHQFKVGGSSAGSAAAVAANLAAVAVGTETSGSILNPSGQNSLVGIKPTLGLVSRQGIIPIAHSQDTAGPMARTVKDAACLLSTLSAVDEQDPVTLTNVQLPGVDFTSFLKKDGCRGAKLGVPQDAVFYEGLTAEKQQLFDNALDRLKQLGAVVADVTIPSADAEWGYDVLTYEFKADVNAYLSQLRPSVKMSCLANVIAFNKHHMERTLKYGQGVLLEAEGTSGTLTEAEYLQALEQDYYLSTEQGIDFALKEFDVEVLVFPHDHGSDLAARAGYPSVIVPIGYTTEGEPFGLTFTGTAYSEPELLKIAYCFEQATKVRRAPNL